MEEFFYSFKTKKNIRSSLLTIYCITAGFYWFVFSCSAEFNKFGYILLHHRDHISKLTGQGAINTIIFSKFIVSFFLVITSYYTISAILSLKNRTMYVHGTDKEYINCPVCNESLLIKGNTEYICSKCKEKSDAFVLRHLSKQKSLGKFSDLKTKSLISLSVAIKASLIAALFMA